MILSRAFKSLDRRSLKRACHQIPPCRDLSSRTVFVSLERVENSVPSIAEIEDRHVENKHRIVHTTTTKYFSPRIRDASSITANFRF
jgi:hypothetical protein